MIKSSKLNISMVIVFAIIVLVSMISYSYFTGKHISKYELVKSSSKFNIKVKEKKNYRSTLLVSDQKNKVSIIQSVNQNYSPSKIRLFVQTGDSLCKKEDNDTIYIFRNNIRYYFILGKIVNQ